MRDIIRTERLDLVPLTPEFLRLSLARQLVDAAKVAGFAIPSEWLDQAAIIAMRLKQLEEDISYQPWSLRAMVLRDTQEMVGQFGCHTAPGPEYLQELSPKGVEFGYTVFPSFRRKGYAQEAIIAFMKWAREHHECRNFIVSISPSNMPSLKLAEKLRFRKIGSHIDEEDGPEDIFELKVD